MKSTIFITVLCLAGTISAQTEVARSVIASGGGVSEGENHRLVGTIGQPAIGRATSNANEVAAGFWYTSFDIPTSVEQHDDHLLPTEFRLEQNYPNPFNPSTTIQFAVPQASDVKVQVFDIIGRRVATLVDQAYEAGVYTVTFDASDLASGVYVYRIQAGDFAETRKLMLLK